MRRAMGLSDLAIELWSMSEQNRRRGSGVATAAWLDDRCTPGFRRVRRLAALRALVGVSLALSACKSSRQAGRAAETEPGIGTGSRPALPAPAPVPTPVTVDGPAPAPSGEGESPDLATAQPPPPSLPESALPLSTCGRWVVDRNGRRVKLASINWYGASDVKHVVGGLDKVPMERVVSTIRELGFNSVRLPFSNDMLRAPRVPPEALAANPALAGKTPLELFDATVEALTRAGLLVILNNHSTHAMWCCNFDDDGLWWTAEHGEEAWIEDWEMVADRYRANPRVVGADLRNEIRIAKPAGGFLPRVPNWGDGGANDWRAAAVRAGNRVLARAPDWLIIVEGLNSGEDLSAAGARPVVLAVPGKLVYSAHQYSFFRPGAPAIPGIGGPTYAAMSAADHRAASERQWGYLTLAGRSHVAPVWLGEFGDGASSDPKWLTNLAAYLRETDIDWAYWPINGGPKPSGDSEPYGLLEDDWSTVRNDWRLSLLRQLQPATQGPGVGDTATACP
jgi:endoglucanase